MVVIVIVGILSAVALPNFLSQSAKAKGTEAKTTISNEESAAILICSELAYSNASIDRVLKLNGLNINVAGNSFIISIKTNKNAIKKLVVSIGIWILKNKSFLFAPRLAAAKSIFLSTF